MSTYRGKHYTEWVDTVKQLRRNGEIQQAETMLLGLIDAAEAEAKRERWAPPSWYYQQLAILYAKEKRFSDEVSVLERYVGNTAVPADDPLRARLTKARTRLAPPAVIIQPTTCPTCNAQIDPPPARTRRCPHCREKVVVRTSKGQRRLLTENEAATEKQAAARKRAERPYRKKAAQLGYDAAAFDSALSSQERTPTDVLSVLAERARRQAAATGDWARSALALHHLAELAANAGRPWEELAQQRLRSELNRHAQWSDPETPMIMRGCQCECCGADQQRSTFGQWNESPPRPHDDCRTPPCTCYIQILDENRPKGRSARLTVDLTAQEESGPSSAAAPNQVRQRGRALLRRLFGYS